MLIKKILNLIHGNIYLVSELPSSTCVFLSLSSLYSFLLIYFYRYFLGWHLFILLNFERDEFSLDFLLVGILCDGGARQCYGLAELSTVHSVFS